jgi:hypothetical protein
MQSSTEELSARVAELRQKTFSELALVSAYQEHEIECKNGRIKLRLGRIPLVNRNCALWCKLTIIGFSA